jgi:hypothetical protein
VFGDAHLAEDDRYRRDSIKHGARLALADA